MQILAVQQPLVAVDMVLGTALMALHQERRWLRAMVAAAIFNPTFNLLLIPLFNHLVENGAVGAAYVEVATELIMLGTALYLLPRGLLDRPTLGTAARILLAGAGLVGVAVALRNVSTVVGVLAGAWPARPTGGWSSKRSCGSCEAASSVADQPLSSTATRTQPVANP
jgi:Na+-driven multidrug efflux pump